MKKGKLPLFSLVAPFEKVLRVEYSPTFVPAKDYSDHIRALMLRWSNPFVDEIGHTRTEIDLTTCLAYPSSPTIESIAALSNILTSNQCNILEDGVNRISQKFYLPEQWRISIRTAILTGTLLVPHKTGFGIHFYYPEKTKIDRNSVLQQVKMIKEKQKRDNYPAIYFSERLGKEEFIEWIRENTNIFEALLFDLPTDLTIRREERTMFWGQIAWLFVQGKTKYLPWLDLVKKAQITIDEAYEKYPGIYEKFDDLLSVPDEEEMRKCYTEFCKAINNITQKSPIRKLRHR